MSKADKIKAKAQEVKGTAKQRIGEDTDDKSLQAKGKAEKVKGNLKQAGEKAKDAFKK